MKKLLSMVAVASLALAPMAQAQDQVAVFRPSGSWQLDFGDDNCMLTRVFSNGEDEVTLGLERTWPGAEMRFLVMGNSLRTFRSAEELGFTFLPTQTERSVRAIKSSPSGTQVLNFGMVMLAPPPAPGTPFGPPPKYDPLAERVLGQNITAIGLGKGLTQPIRLETGELGGAVVGLQACADDLIKTWGIDPAKNRTLSAQAIPQGLPWLASGTIGFGDFAKFGGGANQMRLMIDASGKPTSCHVSKPTLDASLNERICGTLMEKASFTPAKDAGGAAIASYWIGSPMFLLPGPGS